MEPDPTIPLYQFESENKSCKASSLKYGMVANLDFLLWHCGPIESGATKITHSSQESKGFSFMLGVSFCLDVIQEKDACL